MAGEISGFNRLSNQNARSRINIARNRLDDNNQNSRPLLSEFNEDILIHDDNIERRRGFWKRLLERLKTILVFIWFITGYIVVYYCSFSPTDACRTILFDINGNDNYNWVSYYFNFKDTYFVSIEFPLDEHNQLNPTMAKNCKINDTSVYINSVVYDSYHSDADINVLLKHGKNNYLLYRSKEESWCFHDKIGAFCGIYCNEMNICQEGIPRNTSCEGNVRHWEYKVFNTKNEIIYIISMDWIMDSVNIKCDAQNVMVNEKNEITKGVIMDKNEYGNSEMIKFKYKGRIFVFYWIDDYSEWCLQTYWAVYCNIQAKQINEQN